MSPILNELQKRMHSQKLNKWLVVLILSMSCICNWSVCDGDPYCPNDDFKCGPIDYVSYPFWGGTRSLECGREGFQLSCDADVPTITISSLSYRLLQLDFSTNSLTVSRQDLFNTTCTKLLRNTTLDTDIFQFPPNSTDLDLDLHLNLYYGCTGAPANSSNKLKCGDGTGSVVNLFSVGDGGPGAGIRCNSSIYVPINSKAAETLKNPSSSSLNILNAALRTGFSIRWLNYTKQLASPYCNSKAYTGSCKSKTGTDSVNRRLRQRQRVGGVVAGTGISSVCCYATSAANTNPPVSTTPTKSSMAPATSPAPQPGYGLPPVPSRPSSGYHPNNSRNQHGIYPLFSAGKKRGKEIVIIVVAITTAAAIIIVSISMHYLLKRRQSGSGLINPPTSKHDVENFLLQHGSLAPKRYKYCELKKITRSFGEKLGEGGYGKVYKGKLGDGRPVAVKVLAKVDSSSSGEDFMNEVASISRTSHVNVVTLLGFCSQGSKRALVYEFMPNSSLDKFLSHNKSAVATMDLEKLYKIAVGIAKGLEYLHNGCTTRIVHFDIKPQNILLDEDFCPKIADFGLAKLCKKKQSILSSMLGTRGTAGYMAPEVFSRNFGGVSHKSDVYSYGMLLLNMAQQQKVVESNQAEAEVVQSSEDYFPDNIYDEIIREVGFDESLVIEDGEKETITKMCVVGFWCIQTNPSTRPSMSKVVEMLEGSLKSIQIPPKPMLYEPIPESSSTQNSSDHD